MAIDPFYGSIVSAGASLVGGIMGSKGDTARDVRRQNIKQQRTMDWERPRWIRQGAEAAGFNPLLFAGPIGMAPGLSPGGGGNPMGDAVARAGAAIADGFGQAADLDMQKAELELERQRVEALAENLKLRPKVPGVYGTGGDTATDEPEPLLDPAKITVTNASHLDAGAYVDPRSPDAEMGETRYGDIAQEITGGLNMLRDLSYDRKLQRLVKKWGREVADKVHATYGSDASLTLDQAIKLHTDPLKTKEQLRDDKRSGRLVRRQTK